MAVSRQTLLSLLLVGSATLALASSSNTPRDAPHVLLPRTPPSSPGDGGAVTAVSSSSSSAEAFGDRVLLAHGVLGCLAFALIFPLGGILIRALRTRLALWLHVGAQMAGWAMAVVTLGTGIWLADSDGYLSPGSLKYHVVVGLIACLGIVLQPVTGWVHHLLFKRSGGAGGRTAWSYAHIVWGVAMVTLGTLNGAFGLVLEDIATKYIVVYGVLAGVIWAAWMGISVMAQLARRRTQGQAKVVETGSYRDGSGSHDGSLGERGLVAGSGEKPDVPRGHHAA